MRPDFYALSWRGRSVCAITGSGFLVQPPTNLERVVSKLKPLNILGLNGSYTKTGFTARMLQETVDACKQTAEIGAEVPAETATIHLFDFVKLWPPQAHIPEHVQPVAEKLLWADIIIIGSPVFWFARSPIISQFFIDITPFERDGGFPLKGKSLGVVVSFREDGGQKTADDIIGTLRHFKLITPPLGAVWRQETAAHLSEDRWQITDTTNELAPNLVKEALDHRGNSSRLDWM